MSSSPWPPVAAQVHIEVGADPGLGGTALEQAKTCLAALRETGTGLHESNAGAYGAWLQRAGGEGVKRFVLAAEARWPGFGAEVAGAALERIWDRFVARPERFQFPREPGLAGARRVQYLHWRHAQLTLLTAQRSARRRAIHVARVLSSHRPPPSRRMEELMTESLDARRGPASVRAAAGPLTPDRRFAELWFLADWGDVDPHPAWPIFATVLGAPATMAIRSVVTSASARSKWKKEAEAQLAWLLDLCAGLGTALDEIRRPFPLLGAPVRPVPALEAPPAVLDSAARVGIALRTVGLLHLPRLAEATPAEREALTTLLGGRDGRGRVDTQLPRFLGATPDERLDRLRRLVLALGRAVATGQGSADSTGGRGVSDAEGGAPLRAKRWSGGSLRAMRERLADPIERRRWLAEAEASEPTVAMGEAVEVRRERAWEAAIGASASAASLGRRVGWGLLATAGLVFLVVPRSPPGERTALPTLLVVPHAALLVTPLGGEAAEVALGTAPGVLDQRVPRGARVELRVETVELLEAGDAGATLVLGPPGGPPVRVERWEAGRVAGLDLLVDPSVDEPADIEILALPGAWSDVDAAAALAGTGPLPPGAFPLTVRLLVREAR